jgi:hypothetical protein
MNERTSSSGQASVLWVLMRKKKTMLMVEEIFALTEGRLGLYRLPRIEGVV